MEGCKLTKRPAHTDGQKGLTLIEVMIATAILLIITGAIFQLFISQLRAREATSNYMVVSEQNQRALQKMAEELRGTDSEFANVVFSGLQGTSTLEPLVPTELGGSVQTVTIYSTITFKRITGFDMVNGSQLWSEDITFSLNTANNHVERVEGAGAPTMLANYATGLSFYNAPGRIGIILKNSYGDLTSPRGNGAEVENRIEIHPLNSGTN